MSATGPLYPSLQQGSEQESLSSTTHRYICAIVLLLVVVAGTLSAVSKDVTQGFDELAHASYVAYIQHSHAFWPALENLPLLDPERFQFTGAANYLNHPSPYYVLLAYLGPALEGHPAAIIIDRMMNIAMAAAGLAALMMIGLFARLPRPALYAYVVPLGCIPVLAPLAGSINNDNAAFAGGALAMLGGWQLIATGYRRWLLVALGGVVVASWAKLTGLLLAGGLVGGVLVWLYWCGRFQSAWIVSVTIAALLASAPYFAFMLQYGSAAPDTPGQIAMLKSGAHMSGWDTAERLSAPAYVIFFIADFIQQWLPVLAPRNALNNAALAIPVIAGLCAVAGVAISARRMAGRTETPTDVVIVAGALAGTVTFLLHIMFSYDRHVTYGWLMDAYPRYYLPLAAVLPLAALSLLGALKNQGARTVLTGFLIAGPIVFRVLGAPLLSG